MEQYNLEKELQILIKIAEKFSARYGTIYYITKCECGSLDLTIDSYKKKIIYDTKSKSIKRENL